MVYTNKNCVFCNCRYKLPTQRSRTITAKHNGDYYKACEFHYTMYVNNWENRKEEMAAILDANYKRTMAESKFAEEWNKACEALKVKKIKEVKNWLWKN